MSRTLTRYTDLYPALITPRPQGIPDGVKLRILITDAAITIGWLYGGGDVRRLDIPLSPGDVGDEVTYEGGTVLGYTITRHAACSICGGGTRMLRWDPFPDAVYVEEPRKRQAVARRAERKREMTGLIPARYTRR